MLMSQRDVEDIFADLQVDGADRPSGRRLCREDELLERSV